MPTIEFDGPLQLEYSAEVNSTAPYNLESNALSFRAELPTPIPTASNFYFVMSTDETGDNGVEMNVNGNYELVMRVSTGGVDDDLVITYDPTQMQFWRIRESGGILYFETSPGGHTWTTRREVAHSLDLNTLDVTLAAISPDTGTMGYGEGEYGEGIYGGGVTYLAAGQSVFVTEVNTEVLISWPPFVVEEPPRADWIFAIGDGKGTGPEQKLNNASSRSITLNDDTPSTAQFSFTGPDFEAQRARKNIDDLWVYRNGELLERFRITEAVFNCANSQYTLELSCTDYRGLFGRYYLDPVQDVEGDVYQVTEGTEIRDALRSIITKVQARTGGNLGVSVAPDGSNWQVGYKIQTLEDGQFSETDSAWDAISKLTQSRATFRITPQKQAQLYFPVQEIDEAIFLDYGGMVTSYSELPGVQYANVIRQTGDNVTPNGVLYYNSPTLATDPRGRIEVFASDTSLKNAGDIKRAAEANIKNMTLEAPAYALTLKRGRWGGLSHINLGNVVNIAYWPLNHYDQGSVTSINISVDNSDEETVVINAGRKKLEQTDVIRSLQRRMRSIESIRYARPA